MAVVSVRRGADSEYRVIYCRVAIPVMNTRGVLKPFEATIIGKTRPDRCFWLARVIDSTSHITSLIPQNIVQKI